MAFNVECPSGLIVEARSFNISTRKMLRDAKLVAQGKVLTAIADAASVRVIEPGPYLRQTADKDSKPRWDEISLIDLGTFLTKVRARIPTPHTFTHACDCSHVNHREINLKDVKHPPMAQEAIEHLRDGTEIRRTVKYFDPDTETTREVSMTIEMHRGKFARKIATQQREDPSLVGDLTVASQLRDVKPDDGTELAMDADVLEWYLVQAWDLQDNISEAINELVGGMDTRVQTNCANCGAEVEGRFGFDAPFFFPKKKPSRGVRARAKGAITRKTSSRSSSAPPTSPTSTSP